MSAQVQSESSLVLRHDVADLQCLSRWIDGRVTALGLNATLAYAFRLCLEEAVSNVMTHSLPQPGLAPEIAIVMRRSLSGLTIELADHGPPFDPLAFVPAPRAGSLADAPVGGLGIPLMRHYCHAMSYRRDGEANYLTMRFEYPV